MGCRATLSVEAVLYFKKIPLGRFLTRPRGIPAAEQDQSMTTIGARFWVKAFFRGLMVTFFPLTRSSP